MRTNKDREALQKIKSGMSKMKLRYSLRKCNIFYGTYFIKVETLSPLAIWPLGARRTSFHPFPPQMIIFWIGPIKNNNIFLGSQFYSALQKSKGIVGNGQQRKVQEPSLSWGFSPTAALRPGCWGLSRLTGAGRSRGPVPRPGSPVGGPGSWQKPKLTFPRGKASWI